MLTTSIAVLANDITMYGSGRDAEFLWEQVAEPRRVKVATWSDDAVFRQFANLPRHVGQDVYGVARDHEDSVRTVFDELWKCRKGITTGRYYNS